MVKSESYRAAVKRKAIKLYKLAPKCIFLFYSSPETVGPITAGPNTFVFHQGVKEGYTETRCLSIKSVTAFLELVKKAIQTFGYTQAKRTPENYVNKRQMIDCTELHLVTLEEYCF